jgi:deoxyribonuclease V
VRIKRTTALHSWNVHRHEAEQIQLRLASLVVSVDAFANVALIGGVSVHQVDPTTVQATVAVLDVPAMKLIDSASASAKTSFLYVPGLRAFQTGPAIITAFEKLSSAPDLVLWEGHGIAHPRRCGLASHLGILLDIPSVGVAEQLVYGTCHVGELLRPRGSQVSVVDQADGAVIGTVVRTRSDVSPLYVSVGHRVSLESAIRIVLQCADRYRAPEPLRRARILSKKQWPPRYP